MLWCRDCILWNILPNRWAAGQAWNTFLGCIMSLALWLQSQAGVAGGSIRRGSPCAFCHETLIHTSVGALAHSAENFLKKPPGWQVPEKRSVTGQHWLPVSDSVVQTSLAIFLCGRVW